MAGFSLYNKIRFYYKIINDDSFKCTGMAAPHQKIILGYKDRVDLRDNSLYNCRHRVMKGCAFTQSMPKRPFTPTYILFYLLFWPDTWRITIGLIAGILLTPHLTKTESNPLQTGMLFIMLAAIGYAASAKPAKIISTKLRTLVLKNR